MAQTPIFHRWAENARMAGNPKRPLRANFIRQWRKHNNLTLDQLVDRLQVMYDYETTSATLSRTEKGLQAYTQPFLEAVANALGCEPADLIMRTPDADQDIRLVWSQLTPENRKKALEIIKLLKTG